MNVGARCSVRVTVLVTKPTAGPSTLPAIALQATSIRRHDSTAKKDDSNAVKSTACLFNRQCDRCIKDDVPYTVLLGKKQGEVCSSCKQCNGKKTKEEDPGAPEEDAIDHCIVPKFRPTAGLGMHATRSVSRKCCAPISPETCDDDNNNNNAEGEADLEITAASQEDKAADQTPANNEGGVEIEEPAAETPKDLDASTGPIIDNNINMDFAIDDLVADLQPSPKAATDDLVIEPQPSPEAIRDELLSIPPAQPTPLDIFQSIEALGNKFDSSFRTSVNCVEAVETWVNSMEEKLAMKFAAIDEKIRVMDLMTINNTISLSHMANKMSVFTWTGNTTAFNPPAAMSVSNPYGQMPSSWLPRVTDAGQVGDSSISNISRQLTTAWDESQLRRFSQYVVCDPGDISAAITTKNSVYMGGPVSLEIPNLHRLSRVYRVSYTQPIRACRNPCLYHMLRCFPENSNSNNNIHAYLQ
ncbi:hypothetical protein EV702DRAFT_1052293 [Suillus placidus]|uniref:Uncharacterized protein n=1 Tax=Suillus placidus TaxID=48579 RepID=A0A9P6ZFG6_9AGAM|nr:hypothetical protein EV702DRAFT_1052293 [Suillus placidus]